MELISSVFSLILVNHITKVEKILKYNISRLSAIILYYHPVTYFPSLHLYIIDALTLLFRSHDTLGLDVR